MDPQIAASLLSPAALALLGLVIGSFLNVVIHRLPLILERGWKRDSAEMLGVPVELPPEIGIATPRSRCPSCGHEIRWHENIPVLSWLRLRGRCSECKTRISPRYPIVELLTGVLFAAIGWRFPGPAGRSALVRLRRGAGRVGRYRLGYHAAAGQPDSAAVVGRLGRGSVGLDVAAAGSAVGRCRGLSVPVVGVLAVQARPPARKAWGSATSSCSPRSAPGSAPR